MNKKKWIIGFGLLVLIVFAGWGGQLYRGGRASAVSAVASKTSSAAVSTLAAVVVTTVKSAAINRTFSAVGTVKATESVVLKTEATGRVSFIGFKDGQRVKQGQKLLVLDTSIPLAELAQARAELQLAQDNWQRAQALQARQFVSTSAVDQAAAARDVAQAKVSLAQARLSKYTIFAPFSGLLGMRNISVGDILKEGSEVVRLDNIAHLNIDFRLPEALASRLIVGQMLNVQFEAYPSEVFHAHTVAIDSQVDVSGRSLLLRANFANSAYRIKPGMFAKIELQAEHDKAVLFVPEESIVPQGGETFVYRVIAGKAVKTSVLLGQRQSNQVEIRSGLQSGETIVAAGQGRIFRDNTPVEIVENRP